MSYGYTIVQELPRGLDIHNFPVAFMVIITIYSVCLIYAWKQRRFLKKFPCMAFMATP